MADNVLVPPRTEDPEEWYRFLEQLCEKVNTVYDASVTNPPALGFEADTPTTPGGVIATGGSGMILLQWDMATYTGHAYTEIWWNTENNLSTATPKGESAINIETIVVSDETTYYFWLRHINLNGEGGGYSATVSAAAEAVVGFTIDQLLGQLGYNHFQTGFFPIRNVDPLPVLPDSDYPVGTIVALTSQGSRLYKNVDNVWTSGVTAEDIPAEWSVGSTQIVEGAIDVTKFASGIEPVTIVSALPNPVGYTGTKTVLLTTDNKLYRYTGTVWTAAVPTSDLTGTVSDAQIAGLAASKVTGTLIDSQIASISTAKLTGTITSTQIADNAITTPKISAGAVSTAQLAAGAVVADRIAADAITSAKIAAGAITTAKLAAGAVTASNIAADTITGGQIAAGAISASEIAANAITATKIATDAVTADKILANAVTAGKLAANSVVAGKIAAGAIVADDGVISNAAIKTAQIADLQVTTGKIAIGSITTALIGDASITSAKIGAAQVGTAHIGDATITNAKIGTAAVDTLKIGPNAVTVPVGVYTVSPIAVTSPTVPTTVQFASIDSQGQPIHVSFSAINVGYDPGTGVIPSPRIVYRILRNGIVVWGPQELSLPVANATYLATATLLDTPPSGVTPYYFQAYTATPGGGELVQPQLVYSRSLLLLGVKR